MESILFVYQIVPGQDNLLHFSPSLDQCRSAALEQRADLKENDPEYRNLAAMAIYECKMRLPDQQTLVSVLNDETELFRACVVDRRLVEMVAD